VSRGTPCSWQPWESKRAICAASTWARASAYPRLAGAQPVATHTIARPATQPHTRRSAPVERHEIDRKRDRSISEATIYGGAAEEWTLRVCSDGISSLDARRSQSPPQAAPRRRSRHLPRPRVARGGATILEHLNAGLVDEFSIALSPVLFGTGTRLFDGVDASKVALVPVRSEPSSRVTHLTNAVHPRLPRPGSCVRRLGSIDAAGALPRWGGWAGSESTSCRSRAASEAVFRHAAVLGAPDVDDGGRPNGLSHRFERKLPSLQGPEALDDEQ
jgi:hypothetical protein